MDIGMVGLGVMGRNLALNMGDHGYSVASYNRTTSVADRFVADHPDTPGGLKAAHTPEDLAAMLDRPRRAVILVPAGGATDSTMAMLLDHFEPGDVIIDGGNAHWPDTERRVAECAAKGVHFLGSGVSGGEVGARFGPSLMPGGPRDAWDSVKPIWEAIAAKVGADGKALEGAEPGKPVDAPGAVPCTTYIGAGGSGHFVKMVHNGIEYADMQTIAEAYALLRHVAGMSPPEIGDVFERWNTTELDSYLVEITADVLRQDDPGTGEPFVDVVLDAAGQKGTGKWTAMEALDLGVATPTIGEAVFARCVSAARDERVRASEVISGPPAGDPPGAGFVEDVRSALLCAKIAAYAQGFSLIRSRSEEKGWDIDFASLARIWRGGCIIRARLLGDITAAFERDPTLPNLVLDKRFLATITDHAPAWRRVAALAAERGVPAPAFSSALAWFDAYRSARLPASLIQAQRDYFGAHTYERIDRPRGEFFHLDWPGDRSESRVK